MSSEPDGRRVWRVAADAVTAALGLNVWVSLVFVPGLFVGAFRGSQATAVLAGLALLPLAAGVAARSQLLLLLVYPAALLVPASWDDRIILANARSGLAFAVVAVGLVAYLLGAAGLSALAEPPRPERTRRLSSADRPLAPRWRRRFRIYAALTALSACAPIALLYVAHFEPTNVAYLRELYPGRVRAFTTLLGLGVLALWLGLYASFVLGPLRAHRTGDRPLARELARLEAEARRGSPRPAFYLAVVLALGFMALLVLFRYR